MPKKPRRILIVRDFRANFQRLNEPVQVIRSRGKVEILGTWYPEKRVTGAPSVGYAPAQSDADEPERSGKG